MTFRLISAILAAQILLPTAVLAAEELPVRRIDALRALIASEEQYVEDADMALTHPDDVPTVQDVHASEDKAAVAVGIARGWLLLGDHNFRPNEALSIDDALQWRLRSIGLGAAVNTAADREHLSPQTFRDAIQHLADYRWTISPAYRPGDFVSLPDARALFATATGVILPANAVVYPWQEEDQRRTTLTASAVPSTTATTVTYDTVTVPGDRSWWPFGDLRVAVIDEPAPTTMQVPRFVEQTTATATPAPVVQDMPILAALVTGANQALAEPWQQPSADDSVIAQPEPVTDANGNVLPSVRGLDIAKYVSSKTFAITMPSLNITDLNIEHPADATNSTALLAPLQRGVGHLFSYPGEGGTVLVYGHSSNYPWDVSGFATIFRQINKLAVGDKVYVTYGGTFVVYQVTGHQTVPANDLTSVASVADGEELVLYTCWPPDKIDQRYLVRAVPVGTYSI